VPLCCCPKVKQATEVHQQLLCLCLLLPTSQHRCLQALQLCRHCIIIDHQHRAGLGQQQSLHHLDADQAIRLQPLQHQRHAAAVLVGCVHRLLAAMAAVSAARVVQQLLHGLCLHSRWQ
jgi:hypothetical protein